MSIPEYAVPEFSDLDAAFGARRKHFLERDKMPAEFWSGNHPMCKVAMKLFCSGGRLTDHGLKIKDGLDQAAVYRALRALLCSFDPKHEAKIGTVGVALANWCEPA